MTLDGYEGSDHRRISRAIEALTEREIQVLDLISFGNTGKAVAKELQISPRTVEVYRQRALDKLGARNTVDMIRMFVQYRVRIPAEQAVA